MDTGLDFSLGLTNEYPGSILYSDDVWGDDSDLINVVRSSGRCWLTMVMSRSGMALGDSSSWSRVRFGLMHKLTGSSCSGSGLDGAAMASS